MPRPVVTFLHVHVCVGSELWWCEEGSEHETVAYVDGMGS